MQQQDTDTESSRFQLKTTLHSKKQLFIISSIAIALVLVFCLFIFGHGNPPEVIKSDHLLTLPSASSDLPVSNPADSGLPLSGPEDLTPEASFSDEEIEGIKAEVGTTVTPDNEAPIPTDVAGNPTSAPNEFAPDPYFSDALFIGDSRTQGLMMHSGLGNATFYAVKGLSITDIFDKPKINDGGVQKTVSQALGDHSFGKVYSMLGANELGWVYMDKFIEKYGALIDRIKETQPSATIYVQSILPVSADKSSRDEIYNNQNINKFNQAIEQMAKEKGVIYLKVYEAMADENGALPTEASSDGVHLSKEYCLKWEDYLKEHKENE